MTYVCVPRGHTEVSVLVGDARGPIGDYIDLRIAEPQSGRRIWATWCADCEEAVEIRRLENNLTVGSVTILAGFSFLAGLVFLRALDVALVTWAGFWQ